MKISVLVTTYNRPDALGLVLRALAAQSAGDFEVVVADDGSAPDTLAVIEALRPGLGFDLRHVWQADEGFRAPMARNRAAAVATGDYFIFLDGDCVPLRDFIAMHRRLARPNWFVSGNRILLSESFTRQAIAEQIPLWQWSAGQWLAARLTGKVNRLTPVLRLANWSRPQPDWIGAKTCNLAAWKDDFLVVNGFDENFLGWGCEDDDFGQRLRASGVRLASILHRTCSYHLWHPPAPCRPHPSALPPTA